MIQSSLDNKFFTNNRQQLAQLTNAELILVPANGLVQRSGSVEYRFTQDSNFYYLCGINEPNMVLVIDVANTESYLIAGPQTEASVVFEGTYDESAVLKLSGLDKVYEHKPGWEKLNTRLEGLKTVHLLKPPADFVDHYRMYTNPARRALYKAVKKANRQIVTEDIKKHLAQLRVIKQKPELAAIQHAIDITVDSFKVVAKNINNYQYEFEVEAGLAAEIRKRGADGFAYDPICACGENACILHYTQNDKPLGTDHLLLIDAGAQVNHYAADITRTIPLGKYSPRAKQIVEAVIRVQDQALGLIKPGQDFRDYEKAVRNHMIDVLKDLGLIENNLKGLANKYFPHSTSHFLGLDVHDLGDYYQEFKPGMVMTVEPGIYIPEEKIGVRIEDNVLVTESGAQVLTSNLARDPLKLLNG